MRRWAAIIFALAAFFAAPVAHADAIDGEWCSPKGQNLMITGPTIRIPSGATIQGQYSRHAFAYEDPGEGQMIVMELLSEEQMRLFHLKDGITSAAEEWRRCNVTS
jgi:hypothetical protein